MRGGPWGIKHLRCPRRTFRSITSPQTAAVIAAAFCRRANARALYIIYTSECLKSARVTERTQQLQTIIFLSHREAVKCAAAPARRGTTVCGVTPTLFSSSFIYPCDSDFDLFLHPAHFNGGKKVDPGCFIGYSESRSHSTARFTSSGNFLLQ